MAGREAVQGEHAQESESSVNQTFGLCFNIRLGSSSSTCIGKHQAPNVPSPPGPTGIFHLYLLLSQTLIKTCGQLHVSIKTQCFFSIAGGGWWWCRCTGGYKFRLVEVTLQLGSSEIRFWY